MEEEIREATWNFCKEYDFTSRRRDRVILTNHVSAKLEAKYGPEVENLYREDWRDEVAKFCQKYGYD